MKKTYRMYRGFLSILFIVFFLLIWLFFHHIYPLIVSQLTVIPLPSVDANFFLIPVCIMIFCLFIGWLIRNQSWYGLSFAFQNYFMIKRIRRHIKDARFEDEREFDNHLVRLPKIKIDFDNNKTRKSGKIIIQNSIKFDKKLEDMRIDSSLKGYISERQYLSIDRNTYIYEFYSVNSQKQIEIKSKDDFKKWVNETADDYSIRLDDRTTVPFHHIGLTGQTGAGKSFLIQMLCEQVLSKKTKHELFIIDPKRTDVYRMALRIVGSGRTADKSNAIDLIKTFEKRIVERQDELEQFFTKNQNKTYKDAGLPALMLLIDEFGALSSSWKTLPKKEQVEVESILSNIVFMGRQLGCYAIICSQQLNAQTMSTAIREQLVLKVALGSSDEQTYRTLFATGVAIPPILFGPGQGIFSYPGHASIEQPKLLMIPYCSFLDSPT